MTQEQKRILLKGGLWALLGLVIFFIGITRPKALTTTTIYSNDARTQSNKYLYSLLTQGGTENIQTGNVGTNYTGRAIGISFFYNDNIMINKTYNMRINFYLDDLVPAFNTSMVHIQTCNSSSCNPVNLVGISKQNNSGYSTWVQISYTPQMAGNYVRVDLGDEQRNYLTGTTYFGINSVQIESVNQNEDIMNNANQNANNIINNNNSNTQNIIDNDTSNTQAIIDNQNSSTQALIDAGYTCNEQTLTNYDGSENKALNVNGSIETANNFVVSDYIRLKASDTYTLTKESWGNARAYCLYDSNQSLINCDTYASNTTFTITGADYIRYTWSKQSNREVSLTGNICLKDSEEQTKTSKGIFGKLKEIFNILNPFSEDFFAYKLIDLLIDALKSLFIPSKEYLTSWYNDFRDWIELKLGFLSTPITLFLDFINLYLNLEDADIIINIPQITVPNFEDTVLIEAQTFNWGELMNSKSAFSSLWNLYLDFIDVFLILNFLGLCENTYNRIFGGDTTQYEYYTVEETYNIDDETGEARNHMLRQRKTRREKVE